MLKHELRGAIREKAYELARTGEEPPLDYYFIDKDIATDTELTLLKEFETDTKERMELLKRFKCTDPHHDHLKPYRMILLLINNRIADLLWIKEVQEKEV